MFQDSVPAGSYNDPFLSSVIPMVAPTWCHRAKWGNFLRGVNVDWFELRIYTFILVIHLSIVQQLALPFCTFLWNSAAPAVPWDLVCLHFCNVFFRTSETSVFAVPLTASLHHITTFASGRYMPSRCGLFSFWLSGEVKHFVHLIRWNLTAVLCHCGTTWTRACCGTIARPLGLGTESCLLTTCFGSLIVIN